MMSGLDRYQLKNSLLTYSAFRIAALDALQRLREPSDDSDSGYLSELPLLREVAPQVQMELLSSTWKKGCSARLYPPTVVDECVLHCVFERSVEMILSQTDTAKDFLASGPKEVGPEDFVWLPVRIRTLHLTLPLPKSVAAAQPCQVVDSGRQAGYNEVPVGPTPRDQLFEVLGRWRVNRNLAWNFDGLLTTTEILELTQILRKQMG